MGLMSIWIIENLAVPFSSESKYLKLPALLLVGDSVSYINSFEVRPYQIRVSTAIFRIQIELTFFIVLEWGCNHSDFVRDHVEPIIPFTAASPSAYTTRRLVLYVPYKPSQLSDALPQSSLIGPFAAPQSFIDIRSPPRERRWWPAEDIFQPNQVLCSASDPILPAH